MRFIFSINHFDDMHMHHGENMFKHHAFHIGITLTAIVAVAIWWFLDKRSKK